MTANKTVDQLIQARKAASDEMDAFLRRNHPFTNIAYVRYVRLTERYIAAASEVLKAQTCLGRTWPFQNPLRREE